MFRVIIPSKTDTNLIQCVEYLRAAEPQLRKSDIIVINDGARTHASEHLPVTWVDGKKPFIFARNVNIGIQCANSDVFVENDDTRLLTPCGFTRIARLSEKFPFYGALSPALTASWNPDLKWSQPNILTVDNDWLSFVCPFIPKHTRTLVGDLDERFDGYGREDVDYCRRIRLAGMKLGVYGGTKLEHTILPSTFRDNNDDLSRQHAVLNKRAHVLYEEKWRGYKSMPKDIIQSLWVGTELSTMEKLSIRSFLSHGHPFHLYTYGPVKGIPSGTLIKDANEIVDEATIKRFQNLQNFSDWFRYCLVFARGGWWVDLDTVCLRPFDFPEVYVFGEEGLTTGELCIPSSPFKAPAHSPIMHWLINEALKIQWGSMSYCDLGPSLMTRAVKSVGLRYYPAKTFNPIPVGQWKKFLEIVTAFSPDNYAVHMHHATWTHFNNLDVDASYDPSCLYEWLKRRYQVTTGEELPDHIKLLEWGEPPLVTQEPKKLGPKVMRDGHVIQLDSKGNIL